MLKFGVQVSCYRTTWDEIRASIETLEAGRWHSIWFPDHFLPLRARREEERLTAFEGWTLLSVAAGMTERLELGHLVLGNTYRNPALVAKMAATLDQASKGRLVLSLGAAWCELIRKLFTADGPVDYSGRYDIFNLDGWAGAGMSLELFRHKLGVLERHCEAVGRDLAEIKRTLLMPLVVTDDKSTAERSDELLGPGAVAGPRSYVIDRLGEFADEGVEEIVFGAIPTGSVEALQRVEEEIVAAFD
jgi:alkanesulfonate monooxygenase SsuD/methylene tetrahydromethanopterin reductase-like flavin-dependent oxidoreductase (luciferase family)